ncbi:MAG TPA: ATP-binding protein, partial [Ornithinibacter sp.]|nr:ATP-binding protein [Ornithinibacter sp.]
TAWPGRRLPVLLAVAAIAAFGLAALVNPTPLESRLGTVPNPVGLPGSMQLVADAVAVTALGLAAVTLVLAVVGVARRWRGGDELLHQQLVWFALAFCLPLLLLPVAATPWARSWMFAAVSLPAPVAIGVALLQRRLYDIQLVVSRTLTYVLLSVAVAGLHALTVAGAGALLRDSGAAWLPWVAAGVVAAAFLPIRDALQRGVTRLTYGRWSEPAAVLAASGRRLADAADVPALLGSLVDELGQGLGLQRVEIVDARGRVMAGHGTPGDAESDVVLPLLAYGVPVGALRHSPRRLRATDQHLLEDVARQLGGVVHSAALLDTIREGQERLVQAREEERRRLRRDLHDGLGPSLAALTLQVDTLRNRLALAGQGAPVGQGAPAGFDAAGRPSAAGTAAGGEPPAGHPAAGQAPVPGPDLEAELLRLRAGIQSTVHDVRRIVQGLRPPALDEAGLDGALRRLADDVTAGSGLVVHLDLDPADAVPAALEVAAYRVAQEALTNVVRHSGAGHVSVRLAVDVRSVTLEVCDDGCGPGRGRAGGLGVVNMRQRAEEIGGTLAVEEASDLGRGTRVLLWLPVPTSVPVPEHPSAPGHPSAPAPTSGPELTFMPEPEHTSWPTSEPRPVPSSEPEPTFVPEHPSAPRVTPAPAQEVRP